MKTPDHLREMIEVISGELELRPLLTVIVQKACELLRAERGSIGLIDEDRDLIRIEAAYRMPPEELGSISRRGQGLAGAVLATGAPVIFSRYGDVQDPVLKGMDDDVVVGMPIKWRGKILGTFGIGSEGNRRFTPEDLETLELFARHAAIAINNARSYARERRRAVRLRAANVIAESALERDPVKIAAIAETALLTALDIRSRVLKAGQAAPDGAAIFPLRFVVGEYDRLVVTSPTTLALEDKQALEALAAQLGLALERARLLHESTRQLDEIKLLFETSRRLSTAMDLNSVVAAYLSYVAARDQFRCDIALIDDDENGEEGLRIIGRWTQSDGLVRDQIRFRTRQMGITTSLRDFDLVTSADVTTDPNVTDEIKAIVKAEGGSALASIPLTVQGERIGVIMLSFADPHAWTESDLLPYRITGALLAAIIKNRLDHRKLLENEHKLAAMAERRKLARDLHDSVSQLIFSMTLMAQSVAAGFDKSANEGAARVGRLLDIAQLARAEMKALLVELTDPEGEEANSLAALARRNGLNDALRRHRQIAGPAGVDIVLSIEGAERLSPLQSETCLRIAQEAIANAARHGKADRVEVLLRPDETASVFAVDDNGSGLSGANGSEPSSRIGMTSMNARVVEAGGAFAVSPSALGGVRVEVRLPLQ